MTDATKATAGEITPGDLRFAAAILAAEAVTYGEKAEKTGLQKRPIVSAEWARDAKRVRAVSRMLELRAQEMCNAR